MDCSCQGATRANLLWGLQGAVSASSQQRIIRFPAPLLFHKGRVKKEKENIFGWCCSVGDSERRSTSLFLSVSLSRVLIIFPLSCGGTIIFCFLA